MARLLRPFAGIVVFVLLAVCWSSCAAARVFKLCCSTCAAARVLKLCCSSRPAAAVCAEHFLPHGWMRLKRLIEGQDAKLAQPYECLSPVIAAARLADWQASTLELELALAKACCPNEGLLVPFSLSSAATVQEG